MFFIYSALLFLAISFNLSPTVFAAECGGVSTILINCEGNAGDSIFNVLSLVVNIVSIGVGILAVIGISIAAIQWTTSGGNEQTATKAKRRILEIVLGLGIYVATFPLLNWLHVSSDAEHSSTQSNSSTSYPSATPQSQSSTNNSNTPTNNSNNNSNSNSNNNNGNSNRPSSGSNTNNNSVGRNSYMGVTLEHYTDLNDITADMFVERAGIIINYAQQNGWTYGDSKGIPPGSDKFISCDRLIDIDLYTLGFTLQPAGGYTTGMFFWLRRLGFKEERGLNSIKRGSIVWVKYVGGTSGGHVFIVSDWDRQTGKFTRYDAGRYWDHPQPIVTNGFPYTLVDNNFDDYLRVYNLP